MLEDSEDQRTSGGKTEGNSAYGIMDLTRWIMSIDDVEILVGMRSLELRTDGRKRELMQRLMWRLNADYAESDFVANALYPDERELQALRKN